MDVGRHARPAAHPARLHREVARRDGAPLPAGRALPNGPCAEPSSASPRTWATCGAPSGRTPPGWPPTGTPWPTATRANSTARGGGGRSATPTRRRWNCGAQVLEGEYACAHEPHTVLASSLVPLLRLGRLDEARAHHLRGFRLVRPMESMRGAYADHVEFCALSGNEARALELLAERPAYFTDSGDPRSKLDFMAVTALLMDRLTGLGLGDQPVPGPAGREWTASGLAVHTRGEALSLAALFDARNGTSYVSERVRGRMDQRPLVERLPLGVRSRSARHLSPSGSAAGCGSRRLRLRPDRRPPSWSRMPARTRPRSRRCWPRRGGCPRPGARTPSRRGRRSHGQGQELDVRDRAEIADHAAMERGPEGIELFHEAAALYAEAGDPGEALAARARAAYVLALTGGPEEALARVSELYEGVLALLTDGGTGVSQAASVLVGRARILMLLVQETRTRASRGRRLPEGTASGTAGSGTAADEVVGAAEGRRAGAAGAGRAAPLGRADGLAGRGGAGDARGARGARRGRRGRRGAARAGRGRVRGGGIAVVRRRVRVPAGRDRPRHLGDAEEAEQAGAARRWSTEDLAWSRWATRSCTCSSPRSWAPPGTRGPPRNTPWRPRTGPTRRARTTLGASGPAPARRVPAPSGAVGRGRGDPGVGAARPDHRHAR